MATDTYFISPLFCQQHLSSVGKNGAQMCCVSVNFHFNLPSSLILLVSHYTEASSVLSRQMHQHRAFPMLHRHDHPSPIILHSEGVPGSLASPCSSDMRLAASHRCTQVSNEASQALERKRWKEDWRGPAVPPVHVFSTGQISCSN